MSLSPPKWLHEKDRKTANIIRNNGLANMLGEALDSLGKSRIFYLVCICLDAICRKKTACEGGARSCGFGCEVLSYTNYRQKAS